MSGLTSERTVTARKAHVCYHCDGPISVGTKHIVSTWLNDGCFQSGRMHFECTDAWTEMNWGGANPALSQNEHAAPLRYHLTNHDLEWIEANYPLVARNLATLSLRAPVVWC